MSIKEIKKAYQEAIKSKESEVLDKVRRDQAESVVRKAIEDATHAAKERKKNISFTFGAHPVTTEYSIEGLRKAGFEVIVAKQFRESKEIIMTSLILHGWASDSGLEKEPVNREQFNSKVKDLGVLAKTDFSDLDNATIITRLMKESNKDARIDTDLISRVISRGYKKN
jgi:hypothetical protein